MTRHDRTGKTSTFCACLPSACTSTISTLFAAGNAATAAVVCKVFCRQCSSYSIKAYAPLALGVEAFSLDKAWAALFLGLCTRMFDIGGKFAVAILQGCYISIPRAATVLSLECLHASAVLVVTLRLECSSGNYHFADTHMRRWNLLIPLVILSVKGAEAWDSNLETLRIGCGTMLVERRCKRRSWRARFIAHGKVSAEY